jgi:hypothetical protein
MRTAPGFTMAVLALPAPAPLPTPQRFVGCGGSSNVPKTTAPVTIFVTFESGVRDTRNPASL